MTSNDGSEQLSGQLPAAKGMAPFISRHLDVMVIASSNGELFRPANWCCTIAYGTLILAPLYMGLFTLAELTVLTGCRESLPHSPHSPSRNLSCCVSMLPAK